MGTRKASKGSSSAQSLQSFIAKYSPGVAKEGRAALSKLRRLVPGAVEMVYDNYQFLVVGFGPSERASEAVLSLVFAPRWLSVCFLQDGAALSDPQHLLRGSGKKVRNVRLGSAKDLDQRAVRALIRQSLDRAAVPIDGACRRQLVIKSVSSKQRPRRPV